jgi:hypothetical protein
MAYEKKIGIMILFTLSLLLASLGLDNSELFGICRKADLSCRSKIDFIVEPIIPIALSILPILIILLVTREAVFRTWIKFAIPAILFISYIAIPRGTDTSGGIINPGSYIDQEGVVFLLLALFLFISLIIIIVQSIQLSGKKEKK